MKYLRYTSPTDYGFKDPKVNTIETNDIRISDGTYEKYKVMSLEAQKNYKSLRVKNTSGESFEEIFEEYTPEPKEVSELPPSPLEEIKKENEELKKQIESMQQGMAEIMNLIAMQQTP